MQQARLPGPCQDQHCITCPGLHEPSLGWPLISMHGQPPASHPGFMDLLCLTRLFKLAHASIKTCWGLGSEAWGPQEPAQSVLLKPVSAKSTGGSLAHGRELAEMAAVEVGAWRDTAGVPPLPPNPPRFWAVREKSVY